MVALNLNSKTSDQDKDYWATPTDIVNGALLYFKHKRLLPVNAVYGLDVCASKHNTKHESYFDEQADALLQCWGEFLALNEVAWCNPPYSRGSKEKFIQKALDEVKNNVSTIMLLPNDTSAKWFSDCVKCATAVAFICNGRISFINNASGERVNGNNSGSILVLFSEHSNNVAKTFYVTKKHLEELGQ